MRMKRKILCVLLAMCMALSFVVFAGCGDDPPQPPVDSDEETPSDDNSEGSGDIPTLDELLNDESYTVTVGSEHGNEPIEDESWQKLLLSTEPLELNESYTEDWSRPLEETRLRPYLRYFELPGEEPQATWEFIEHEGGKSVKINCNGAPGGASDYVNFRGMRFTAGAYYEVSVTYSTLTAGADYYFGFDHYGVRIVDMPATETGNTNTVSSIFKVTELYDNNNIASLTVVSDAVAEPSSIRIDSITIKRIEFTEEDTRSLALEIGESITEDFERYVSVSVTSSVFGTITSHTAHIVTVEEGFDGQAVRIQDAATNWNFTAFFHDTRGQFNAGRYRATMDIRLDAKNEAGASMDIGMLEGKDGPDFDTVSLNEVELNTVTRISAEFYFDGSANEYFFFGCMGGDVYVDNLTLERLPLPGADSLKDPGDSITENFDDFKGLDGSLSVLGSFHSNCFDFTDPAVKDNVQIIEDPAGGNYLSVDDAESQMDTNLHFIAGTQGKLAPGSYTITVTVIAEEVLEGGRLDIGFLGGAAWNGQTRVLTAGQEKVTLDPVTLTISDSDAKNCYLYMGCLKAKIRIESITITKN